MGKTDGALVGVRTGGPPTIDEGNGSFIGVNSGSGVSVGQGASVAVGIVVGLFDGVGVRVNVLVGTGVLVAEGVGEGVLVGNGVEVGIGVGVEVDVGTMVGVGVIIFIVDELASTCFVVSATKAKRSFKVAVPDIPGATALIVPEETPLSPMVKVGKFVQEVDEASC